jgi:CHAT domain-containing protein
MNILARLAILSGCETGIGHIKKGEGILSLARAFKFAGCPNIIMSLWKVNDKTTKEIMVAFNKYLKKGMEKDRALQLAKINYLKGSKNLHPVFWSSFVLIGNEDPIRHPGKVVLYCAIMLCIMLLLILIKKYNINFKR